MTSGTSPPRPELALCVGLTGHRRLSAKGRAGVSAALGRLFGDLPRLVGEVQAENAQTFSPAKPALYLVTGLAAGADQLAARQALTAGFGLRAVLPFALDDYRQDFQGPALAEFDALLALSQTWTLPPQAGSRDRGYASAGESTVAQCDILVAVWDGEAARGLGGTAEVVEYAVRRGTPVIWIPADGVGEAAIVWGGFDGSTPDRLDRHCAPRRPLDEAALKQLLDAVLAPPSEPGERRAVAAYLAERRPGWGWRLEYPLLLAAMGVGLRRARWGQGADHAAFRDLPVGGAAQTATGQDVLEDAFIWADGLADHVAQNYRSGLVFNYAAAAAAVLLALTGIVAPRAKVGLELAELVVIGLLIFNTAAGAQRQWHGRWLNYRYLAEQLRPLRGLKLLAAATPPRQIAVGLGPSGRWTDWYARAVWRRMGPPPTIPDAQALSALVTHFVERELEPQIAYHAANAERMRRLDHRLHLVGTALFCVTVAVGLASLAALLVNSEAIHPLGGALVVLAAGLPTVGAALFGIRGQGDFIGASGRSSETEARLRAAAATLRLHADDLMLSCRAAENAAATMLSDLTDWRTAYRHRKLAIPS